MKNSEILVNSLNTWATPIIHGYINNMANQSQMGYFLSGLISPERLVSSLHKHLSVPLAMDYINKMPDHLLPEFSLDIVEGIIEERVKKGPITVPFIDANLGADAFRTLKDIMAKGYSEYGDKPAQPVQPQPAPQVPPTTASAPNNTTKV